MNKKWIIAIVLVVVLVGLLVVAGRLDRDTSISANDIPETQETPVAPTAPEQTDSAQPEESTEPSIPGVEDSIFDDEEPAVVPGREQTNTGNETKDPATDTKEPTGNTEPTQKPEATEPTTKPTEPADKPSGGNTDSGKMTYDDYQSMSPAEQQEYMDSFENIDGFFDWYNSAKDQYEEENPPIDVGDGEIDLGEIIGGNG